MNKRRYLICFLIALALTCLTSFSAAALIRSAAERLLASVTDEATIELLTPLRYLRFRISILPAAVGAAAVSLPIYRIRMARRAASRIGWIVLTLFLLLVIWVVSLFTLRIGLASLVKIILTLIDTLLRLH